MDSREKLRAFLEEHPPALALTSLVFALLGAAAIVTDPPSWRSEWMIDYVFGPLAIVMGVVGVLVAVGRMSARRSTR